MTDRIIKGYWDCTYCGTEHIDGLIDVCPNCAKRKPSNTKYYIGTTDRSKMQEVSEKELFKAGIAKNECDGKHKEWACSYCGQLNNYADMECKACGATKADKSGEYGEDILPKRRYESNKQLKYENNEQTLLETNSYTGNVPIMKNKIFMPIAIILLSIILGVIGFFPYTEKRTVSGFLWERTISVEELKTFHESGWSLPHGARETNAQRELYGYKSVIDHYETKSRTVSKQVLDGYDTHYSYSDNGNGTFTEHSYETPRYRTEYETEYYQEPIYRQEPVYETKYYYDIDRWTIIEDYVSSGNNHIPYWNTNYELKSGQRDTARKENYFYTYITDKGIENKEKTSYEKWEKLYIGETFESTKCLIGITYKSNQLENMK